MGETTRVTFDAKTIRDLGSSIGRAIAEQFTEREQQRAAAEPADAPAAVHIEPWHIFDPRRQAVTAAYLDDANQTRWVPVADELDVPKAWRKLFVQRPA